MPVRASEMHTKSLWARCRIVRCREGDAKTGVKGARGRRLEAGGEGRRERDVKSEIIINDSHEDECLIYMRRSMAWGGEGDVYRALFSASSRRYSSPFIAYLFSQRKRSVRASRRFR